MYIYNVIVVIDSFVFSQTMLFNRSGQGTRNPRNSVPPARIPKAQ